MDAVLSAESEEPRTSNNQPLLPRPLSERMKWIADDGGIEVNDALLRQELDDDDDEEEEEEVDGKEFGVILGRTKSSLSDYFHRLRVDKEINPTDLRAVGRAFSMGRTARGPGEYRRIHHNCEPSAGGEARITSNGSSRKRNTIFETWRNFFGFSR